MFLESRILGSALSGSQETEWIFYEKNNFHFLGWNNLVFGSFSAGTIRSTTGNAGTHAECRGTAAFFHSRDAVARMRAGVRRQLCVALVLGE
jgi:hypothetical protein